MIISYNRAWTGVNEVDDFVLFRDTETNRYHWYPSRYDEHPLFGETLERAFSGTFTNANVDTYMQDTSGLTVLRRNIAPDPSGTDAANFESNAVGSHAPTGTAMRWTRVTIGSAGRFSIRIPSMSSNTEYTIRLKIRASTQFGGITPSYRPSIVSGTGATTFGVITIPEGESEWTFSGVTSSTSYGSTSGLAFVTAATGPAIDSWFEIYEIIMEVGPTVGTWFSGDTPADEYTYLWTGTPNATPSTMNRRGLTNYKVVAGTLWQGMENGQPVLRVQAPVSEAAFSVSMDPDPTLTIGDPQTLLLDFVANWNGFVRARIASGASGEVFIPVVAGVRQSVRVFGARDNSSANVVGMVARPGDGYTFAQGQLTIYSMGLINGTYEGDLFTGTITRTVPDTPRYPY